MDFTSTPNYKELPKDKDYFNAYLNMARHNAFIVLSSITEQLGKPPAEENKLTDMYALRILLEKDKPDITLKVIEKLDKHFPFLRPMFDNDIKHDQYSEKKGMARQRGIDLASDYHNTLSVLLLQLNKHRNYYTHPVHADITVDEKLGYYLIATYDAAIRLVKDRFQLSENQLSHLRRYRGKNKTPDFKYEIIGNRGKLSEKGIAFFICLFLEKKYAFMFLKKLRDFKADYTPDKLATLETYCVYRMRMPKLRLESGDDSLGLTLDMFNELKRCPRRLFELLGEGDQKKFRVKIDQCQELAQTNGEYDEEILLMRYRDRFPYFALSYIDQQEVFQHLRFHVDLGNYYYKFYDKTTIDGIQRDRSLKKHLKAFGRLHELRKQRLDECGEMIMRPIDREENDMRPYLTDTYPHYHINSNQVGLKLCLNGKAEFPTLKGQNTITKAPDFWLSAWELPGMVFYAWLNKDSETNPAERVILDYRKNYHKLLKRINEPDFNSNPDKEYWIGNLPANYSIGFFDLPDQVRDILLGNKGKDTGEIAFVKHAERKLKEITDETRKK